MRAAALNPPARMMETPPATRSVATIDGTALHYFRRGSGQPLLYLHGVGGVAAWLPWMDDLARRYDVIVPDHPGFGDSPMPDWLDSIHDLAYFYLDVIEELGLDRVLVVGHSMGGWLALEMAVRNTSRMAGLALVAPAGLRLRGARPFDIFLESPEASARAAYYDQTIAERLIAAPQSEADVDRLLRNRLTSARLTWEPRLFDPHLHKWLHRVDVPTAVLWGANDGILPPAMQAEFVRLIPGATAETVPHCGHVPMIEAPEAFAAFIDRFAQGVPA